MITTGISTARIFELFEFVNEPEFSDRYDDHFSYPLETIVDILQGFVAEDPEFKTTPVKRGIWLFALNRVVSVDYQNSNRNWSWKVDNSCAKWVEEQLGYLTDEERKLMWCCDSWIKEREGLRKEAEKERKAELKQSRKKRTPK